MGIAFQPIQLPVNVPGKAREDGSKCLGPCTDMEDLEEAPGFQCFRSDQLILLWAFGEGRCEPADERSLLNNSAFQTNKKS